MEALAGLFGRLSLGGGPSESSSLPSASVARRVPGDYYYEDDDRVERSISYSGRGSRRRSSPGPVAASVLGGRKAQQAQQTPVSLRARSPEPVTAPPRVQKARTTPTSTSRSCPPGNDTARPTRCRTEPTPGTQSHEPITAPPRMQKSQSAPPRSVSSSATTMKRCSGITLAGRPCQKIFKVPLEELHDSDSNEEASKYYCHLHRKMRSDVPALPISTADGQQLVITEHWIPPWLNANTKIRLLEAMQKTVSTADEPGHLYCLGILDTNSDLCHFKVGRAVNLPERIREWHNQCTAHQQVLRCYWPEGLDIGSTSYSPASLNPTMKAPHCHLAERLIHILLAFQAQYAPYLEPAYPHIDGDSLPLRYPVRREPCASPDCKNKVHKEIFSFKRISSGPWAGRELERIVLPAFEWVGNFMLVHHGELIRSNDDAQVPIYID